MGKFRTGDKVKFESLVGDIEGEITHGSPSEQASECLSLLAHPTFSRFIMSTDDIELTKLYSDLYQKLKEYEIWKQS